MKTIIVRNNTQNILQINSLGLRIPVGEESQINYENILRILGSQQFMDMIDSEDIIINDGTSDLSPSDARSFLLLETDLSNYYDIPTVDGLLSDKSPAIHNHDDLYYGKTEVDDLISNIEVYGIKGAVDFYSELPTGQEGDVYIVRYSDVDNQEGFYRYDGSWIWLAHNVGTQNHNELSGLNEGDFQHLSQSQKNGLVGGGDTVLHHHDGRYYTEAEIDALLAQKANVTHNHDARYYTKSQTDVLLGNIDYEFVSGNDSNTNITGAQLEQLVGGGNADHLHTHAGGGGGGGGTGGLDDAYNGHNEWGRWGQGREINVDWGPVQINASGGFAPLRLSEINYVPNQWLGGGEICFYDQELFYRDTNRAVWLSIASYQIWGTTNQTNVSDQYLQLGPGNSMSSTIGWTAPWDGRIVFIGFSNDRGNANGNVIIRRNGSDISQGNLWYSGHSSYKNDCNGAFNAGDVLSIYIASTSNNQAPHRPMVWAGIKRRI